MYAILNQKSKCTKKSDIHKLERLGKLKLRVVITFVKKCNRFLSVSCPVGHLSMSISCRVDEYFLSVSFCLRVKQLGQLQL